MYGEPGSRSFVALTSDLGDYFFIDSGVSVSAHVVVSGNESVIGAWLEIVDVCGHSERGDYVELCLEAGNRSLEEGGDGDWADQLG